VTIIGPALLRDALVGADVQLEHLEAVLALETARDAPGEQGVERPVEIDDSPIGVDDEIAVDDRVRHPLEFGEERLERWRRGLHPPRC
jgi:hypothetical protein